MIEVGKTYFGQNDCRRFVEAVEGDQVTYSLPSCHQAVCTVSEMEEWASESSRRIYYGANRERREKLAVGTSNEIGRVSQSEDDPDQIWVMYQMLGTQPRLQFMPLDQWEAWRDKLGENGGDA